MMGIVSIRGGDKSTRYRYEIRSNIVLVRIKILELFYSFPPTYRQAGAIHRIPVPYPLQMSLCFPTLLTMHI